MDTYLQQKTDHVKIFKAGQQRTEAEDWPTENRRCADGVTQRLRAGQQKTDGVQTE